MNRENLERAVVLARRLGRIFVATADPQGLPHVAAAGKLEVLPADRVAVSAWFCPGTVANLQNNPRISLVIWNPGEDEGFQLLGQMEGLEETAMMNGYAPEKEEKFLLPQVERKIVLRVEKILDFKLAPHSDQEP